MDILSLLVLAGIAIIASGVGAFIVWCLKPTTTTRVEITFQKKDEDKEDYDEHGPLV